jgi:hypothetical protein
VIVDVATVLRVTTDELLGVKKANVPRESPEVRRLWRRFQQVLDLPEKNRRAIIRMINSLAAQR